MSDTSERQHYRLATGQGLTPPPPKGGHSGYAKGGKVMKKSAIPRRNSGRGR
jgi:hypothetical protein